jgi:FkbM family methyltransferase
MEQQKINHKINFIKKNEINNIKSIFFNKDFFNKKRIYIYGSGIASKNLKKYLVRYNLISKKYLKEKDLLKKKITSKDIILNNSYKIRINKNNFYDKNKKKIFDVDVHFYKNYKNYKNYLRREYRKFLYLFNKLQDNQSKRLLNSFVKVKLSNDFSEIKNSISEDQYYLKKLGIKFDNFVDVGGYDGDTLKFFLKKKFQFKQYFIFEPDIKNFLKIKRYVKSINKNNIFLFNNAVGSKDGEIFFHSLGKSTSNMKPKKNPNTKKIKIVKLDNIIKEINFLKIDVENYENHVLMGAKKLISTFKPVIACAVYHSKKQLMDIFYTLKSFNKDYKFYLRLYSKSSNELILYAK